MIFRGIGIFGEALLELIETEQGFGDTSLCLC
jgi:hypothetical protein